MSFSRIPHAGKVFAVLLLAIYKIVVLSIGDRLERARIDFAVGARPCNLALAIRERAPRAARSGEPNHPIGVPGPVQQSSSFSSFESILTSLLNLLTRVQRNRCANVGR